MKTKNIPILFLIIMSIMTGRFFADEHQQAYLGVRLDPKPLPELLSKHLKLEVGQGLLIKNIYVNSPADKAGLDRDDIIIAFQGEDVFDYQDFVRDIQGAGVDENVELKVIHLGEKKIVSTKLEYLNGRFDSDDLHWKYPIESEVSQMWRPGRIFRFNPGDEDWTQIPFKDVPEIEMELKKFFKEKYFFQHSADDEEFSVTIEGSPYDSSSTVTLETGRKKEHKIYITTIGEIDELPKKYRSTIRNDIEEARADATKNHEDIDQRQSEIRKHDEELFKEFEVKIPKPEFFRRKLESFDFNNKLQDMQEEMEKLKKKIAELERSFKSRSAPAEEPQGKTPPDTTEEQI